MNDHSSDESELDEYSNRGHEGIKIDDDLKRQNDKKIPQHQRRIIIEPFDSKFSQSHYLHKYSVFRNITIST